MCLLAVIALAYSKMSLQEGYGDGQDPHEQRAAI
eukprot:COSAG02_NODE_35964_length_460_cov_5.639889_1_plen_33_part_10